jgi:hypothetical protein
MSDFEREKAGVLDAYLTARQTGKQPLAPSNILPDEVAFVEELLDLIKRHEPDPGFISGLGHRLAATVARQEAASPEGSRESSPRGSAEGIGMGKRILFPLMGVVVLGVVLVLALVVLGDRFVPGDDELVVAPTATAVITESPTTDVAPSTPSPGATEEVAQLLTPTPIIVPGELPVLPTLPELMAGGYGGGGGGESVPPEVALVLEATFPDSPEQMTAYWQGDAGPITVEYAREFTERLGLDAEIYIPRVLEPGEVPALYIAVDEPYQVIFEGTSVFYFTDRSVFPKHGGHWMPPENLPPVEEAQAIAEAFLSDRGLLDGPYQASFDTYEDTGTIHFLHVLAGDNVLYQPFAAVTVNSDGEVGRVVYHSLLLETLGDYPIIPAAEAWSILTSGEVTGRVWRASGALTAPPRDLRAANPRYWARTYDPGAEADLFGPIVALLPADHDGVPYIEMADLVLTGEPGVLAELAQTYAQLVESMGIVEVPMHVWGTVADAGSRQTLAVEGWESAVDMPTFWTGTIQQGELLTEGGEAISVPSLPADLADGTAVFVSGGLVEDELAWYLIQEHPADQGMPYGEGEQPAEVRATVKRVDLVYLTPRLANISPDALVDFGYRVVQPVWRFQGTTDLGADFAIYVQAATDDYRAP